MRFASLFALVGALMVSQVAGAEWVFPEDGPSSSGHSSLGKTGRFQGYCTVTNHSPEEVFLWYAKKLELGENHDLVKKAQAGFGSSEKLNLLSYSIGRDTDSEKWGAIIRGSLSPKVAHIHIFVRPKNQSKNDVTISIAKTPAGTAISVIQSLPSEAKNKVAKAK